jgi:hypothetical protein
MMPSMDGWRDGWKKLHGKWPRHPLLYVMNPNTISLQGKANKTFFFVLLMKKWFWFRFSQSSYYPSQKILELKTQGSLKFYGIEVRDSFEK